MATENCLPMKSPRPHRPCVNWTPTGTAPSHPKRYDEILPNWLAADSVKNNDLADDGQTVAVPSDRYVESANGPMRDTDL